MLLGSGHHDRDARAVQAGIVPDRTPPTEPHPGGTARSVRPSEASPMLDSPSLGPAIPGLIAVRRAPPAVEDPRPTTVADDPIQRRDLLLMERARAGDLDAFNDL